MHNSWTMVYGPWMPNKYLEFLYSPSSYCSEIYTDSAKGLIEIEALRVKNSKNVKNLNIHILSHYKDPFTATHFPSTQYSTGQQCQLSSGYYWLYHGSRHLIYTLGL